jgi:hypothetical protein
MSYGKNGWCRSKRQALGGNVWNFNVVVCGSSCTAHDVSKFYPRFLLVKQPYFC